MSLHTEQDIQENIQQVEELKEEYETDFEIGQDNVQPMGMDIHNPVFL